PLPLARLPSFPTRRSSDLVPAWAARDYGNRVGVFRLMKVLDRYGVRGTVALNSDLCVQHPEIIEECKARKWEFMGHNESNTRRLDRKSTRLNSSHLGISYA